MRGITQGATLPAWFYLSVTTSKFFLSQLLSKPPWDFPLLPQVLDNAKYVDYEKDDPVAMAKAYKRTWFWALTVSIAIFVVWPLLTLPAGVFSEGYFTFWVVLSMAWGTVAAVIVVLYPLLESREVLTNVLFCRPYKFEADVSVAAAKKSSGKDDPIEDKDLTVVDAR
jgi:hypothetical protein